MDKNNFAAKGTITYGIFCFFTAIVFSLPLQVYAQTDTLKKIDQIEILSKELPHVKALIPVQTISQKDFVRYNANNVAEAIRNFSGVNIRDYGGIGGLKTVSVRSLGANYTGVLYDGVQLNDAQNGQVDLGKLSLDNLSTIELFNAQPTDLLLPARAYTFASVLSLKTIKPQLTAQDPTKIDAEIKTGSFGWFAPAVQYQQLLKKDLSLRVNTSWNTANGKYRYKIDGDGSDDLYERNNADLMAYRADAQVNYSKDSTADLSLSVNYYASQNGLPGAVIFYKDHSAQRLWTDEWFMHGKYRKKLGRQFELLFNSKYAHNYVRYLDPEFLNQQGKLDQKYLQKEYYQSAVVLFKAKENLIFSYAADGVVNTLTTNLYQYAYPTRLTFLQAMAGNYKTGIWNFGANLLHTNIKEWVKKGTATASSAVFSPTLMISAEPFVNSGIQFRAFYKDVFRAPTFNDLYYTRIGNKDLEPEKAKQFNVGMVFSKAFAHKLNFITITADAYYNDVRNKIIAVPNKDIFTWSMQNLGRVDIRGIDVSVKSAYTLAERSELLFAGNYTFQQAVDVTDPSSSVYLAQIPYVPEHTFSFNTGINYKGLGVFYNQLYSAHRYYLGENLPEFLVPGFSVSDVSVSCSSKINRLPYKAALEVNNLFDAQYAFIRSFPMPGRSFRFSIHVTF